MNKSLKTLGAASAAVFVLSLSAHATNYAGNTDNGFGGPVGNGMLAFNSSSGTVTGTITPGPNVTPNGQLYDELVIYISTSGTTGFNSTSTLTDNTTTDATLARAVSGYDGTNRATINFATGFFAKYALAISPTNSQLGELFGLTSAGKFTALQSLNLTPVNSQGNPNYTFSFSLANIGSPASFNFSTTYINAHPNGSGAIGVYRAGEAFNSVTDTTSGVVQTGGANVGTDTATLGVNTFVTGLAVPEPSTWAMMLCGAGLLFGFQRRLRRQA